MGNRHKVDTKWMEYDTYEDSIVVMKWWTLLHLDWFGESQWWSCFSGENPNFSGEIQVPRNWHVVCSG